jgi:hypothetical protein
MNPFYIVFFPFIAAALLQIKHCVVDFIWQPPYEWKNKGTFLHFGGIRHAGKNAIGTALAIYAGFFFYHTLWAIALIAVLDFVIHYLVDYTKMNITKAKGWKADTCPKFWWALGIDQMMHQLTYIFLIILAIFLLT